MIREIKIIVAIAAILTGFGIYFQTSYEVKASGGHAGGFPEERK